MKKKKNSIINRLGFIRSFYDYDRENNGDDGFDNVYSFIDSDIDLGGDVGIDAGGDIGGGFGIDGGMCCENDEFNEDFFDEDNSSLARAKVEKNDEFYTLYETIEDEVKYYKDDLRGKKVFCNCDDPRWSNFWKFLSDHFEEYGLKKLVAMFYNEKESFKKIKEKVEGKIKTRTEKIEGNGDFRSEESLEELANCDVVISNPPFSLFREYIKTLFDFKKKFLVIGNINLFSSGFIKEMLVKGKIWTGLSKTGIWFTVPNHYVVMKKKDGKNYSIVGTACWFTNIQPKKLDEIEDKGGYGFVRDENYILEKGVPLFKKYNAKDYKKIDKTNIINIEKTIDIPYNFKGVMAAPITFLRHYSPKQFEILDTKLYKQGPLTINGKELYARVLIKNKGNKKFNKRMLQLFFWLKSQNLEEKENIKKLLNKEYDCDIKEKKVESGVIFYEEKSRNNIDIIVKLNNGTEYYYNNSNIENTFTKNTLHDTVGSVTWETLPDSKKRTIMRILEEAEIDNTEKYIKEEK